MSIFKQALTQKQIVLSIFLSVSHLSQSPVFLFASSFQEPGKPGFSV